MCTWMPALSTWPLICCPATLLLCPQVRRAEQALFEETGAAPTPQAVADRVGLSYSKLMQVCGRATVGVPSRCLTSGHPRPCRAACSLGAWEGVCQWCTRSGRADSLAVTLVSARIMQSLLLTCCPLPHPPLPRLQLYKSFRPPTSRDDGPLGAADNSGEDKNTGEQWVEEVDDVSPRPLFVFCLPALPPPACLATSCCCLLLSPLLRKDEANFADRWHGCLPRRACCRPRRPPMAVAHPRRHALPCPCRMRTPRRLRTTA